MSWPRIVSILVVLAITVVTWMTMAAMVSAEFTWKLGYLTVAYVLECNVIAGLFREWRGTR